MGELVIIMESTSDGEIQKDLLVESEIEHYLKPCPIHYPGFVGAFVVNLVSDALWAPSLDSIEDTTTLLGQHANWRVVSVCVCAQQRVAEGLN